LNLNTRFEGDVIRTEVADLVVLAPEMVDQFLGADLNVGGRQLAEVEVANDAFLTHCDAFLSLTQA